jgi:hypothetical protein
LSETLLPAPSWKLPTVGFVSMSTVLDPSVMQTLAPAAGSPDGVQFPPILQFPLLSDQTDGVPLSVQDANDGVAVSASIPRASATGDAAARCLRVILLIVMNVLPREIRQPGLT